jgi:hypothetical protein
VPGVNPLVKLYSIPYEFVALQPCVKVPATVAADIVILVAAPVATVVVLIPVPDAATFIELAPPPDTGMFPLLGSISVYDLYLNTLKDPYYVFTKQKYGTTGTLFEKEWHFAKIFTATPTSWDTTVYRS